jgi:hypothetical protein
MSAGFRDVRKKVLMRGKVTIDAERVASGGGGAGVGVR